MEFLEVLGKRRSIYKLNKELPLSKGELEDFIGQVVTLSPDAFNAQSLRSVVLMGEDQNELWDLVYESFDGMVAREKTDGFKAAAGTILFFLDRPTITKLEEDFPLYAKNFYFWGHQASGMLQINLWNGLRSLGIGANLQHYNPVIDEKVKRRWEIPEGWELLAQMPFGGIGEGPGPLEKKPLEEKLRFY